VARDHGFDHWDQLVAHVESLRDATDAWRHDAAANLPNAANAGDLAKVRALLEMGEFTQHDLDLALARAVLRFSERREIAELLVGHGADPDGQYGSEYGPIVFVTGECLDPDGLQFLIDHGADVAFAPVATKYGAQCPLSSVLGSYLRGCNPAKHRAIDLLLAHGAHVPVEVTPPILAIHRGDADALAALVAAEPALVHRTMQLPYGNLPLAGATLLHCAVELGELACLDLLVERGADLNARAEVIENVGGQTPIFHAIHSVAGGNVYTLEHLVRRYGDRLDLTARASWSGRPETVTPREYATRPDELALLDLAGSR
jgi:hypothetical protein